MQLLQMDIVPKFSEWAKQGEMGRRKINNVTRYFYYSSFYPINRHGFPI